MKGNSRTSIEKFNRGEKIDTMLGNVGLSLGFIPFELHSLCNYNCSHMSSIDSGNPGVDILGLMGKGGS